MKAFSESLNRQIIALAPSYVAVPDAPNTFKDLQRYGYDDIGRLRVYNGSSDATIYADDRVNFAFRAWHDSLHLQYGLDFSFESEMKIAQIHADMITGDYEKRLIFADVAAQVIHWAKFRQYVTDQRACVARYLNTKEVILC